jgi:hypothetical protein
MRGTGNYVAQYAPPYSKVNKMYNKFLSFIHFKIAEIKAKLMLKWARESGLNVVEIVKRGGTEYIRTPDGQMLKIGKRK